MEINGTLPRTGTDGIRPGEIYERRLFTEVQVKELIKTWRIRPGTIQDSGHKGVQVLQFIAKR